MTVAPSRAGARRPLPGHHPQHRGPAFGGPPRWAAAAPIAVAVVGIPLLTLTAGWSWTVAVGGVATLVAGFRRRRSRWWGLGCAGVGLVLILQVLAGWGVRTVVIASVLIFALLSGAWIAGHGTDALPRPTLPRPARRGGGRRPGPRHSIRRQLLLGVPTGILVVVVISLIGAAATPGNENFQAKWADWLRSHHNAGVAKELETIYYQAQKPRAGGRPAHLNRVPGAASTSTQRRVAAGHLAPPATIPLLVQPALPQEGIWQPAGQPVNGIPAMYEAQFRADRVYTSAITSAVWIDPTVAHLQLVPGAQEPGGTWSHPPYITPSELPSAIAAFNGGFRFQDAQGGFYLNGVTAVPLRPGAASLVLYRSGRIDVGAWGTEVTMTPDVVGVLQNLVPMVDNGQPATNATYNDKKLWGATLGPSTVVARSGVGVTASGALVYVAGPDLTAKSLAESLQRAGAVRGMSLDINPEWVTFNFFEHPDPTNPASVTPAKLYPAMTRPATRYLGPTAESRDFVEVSG